MKRIFLGIILSVFAMSPCFGSDVDKDGNVPLEKILGTYTGNGNTVTITHKSDDIFYVNTKNPEATACELEGNTRLVKSTDANLSYILECDDPMFAVQFNNNGTISIQAPNFTVPIFCFSDTELKKEK